MKPGKTPGFRNGRERAGSLGTSVASVPRGRGTHGDAEHGYAASNRPLFGATHGVGRCDFATYPIQVLHGEFVTQYYHYLFI